MASLKKVHFIIGSNRIFTVKEIKGSAPVFHSSKLLLDADVQQLQEGNFFCLPTQDVLKKIKSEEKAYGKLSDCPKREISATRKLWQL